MSTKLSYREILEGIVKLNVLFFVVMIFMIWQGVEGVTFDTYYYMLGLQLFLVFFSIVFAKIYMKFHKTKVQTMEVTNQSVYIGLVATNILLCMCGMYLGDFSLNAHLFLLVSLSLFGSFVFWFSVFFFQSIKVFLKHLLKFLDTEFTYKDFIYVVIIMNSAFFVIIAAVLLMGPTNGRNIFESLFVIFYFEAAFFVTHFVVAKIVDLAWNSKNEKTWNVSMLGMIMGSIFYITKINVIDKSVLNLFYFDSTQGSTPILAVVTLMLFWSFFALLFHFECKNPLKGRRFGKK
jgi:hypothetical protein